MERTEFQRTTPEQQGISSQVVLDFLESMNDGHTELHSLMIMSHDDIIGEGWAKPYTQGMRHTMMSTTKTFTGTAIGLAIDEGILSLDEKIVDIFREYVPVDASEYLKKITIYHLLTMTSGMEEACVVDENYISNFMNTPVLHEPGTDFFYNDSAVSLLPAIIYKKTGLSMLEFLKPRLFDKIGIDVNNLTWFNVATGTAFGAGGLFCTTEDALRLMKLYANGGIWNGEQVLSKEYVKEATRAHIQTNTKTERTEFLPKDNQYGYGYLMWMGSKPGTYRSEGAYGQITLVDPSTEIIISFTEANHSFDPASQESMDRCWKFLDKVDINRTSLPGDKKQSDALKKAFDTLALPSVPCAPYGSFIHENEVFKTKNEGVHPEHLFYSQVKSHPVAKTITGITSFAFYQVAPRLVEMKGMINGKQEILYIPTDGSMRLNTLDAYYKSLVYTSGYWKDKNEFVVIFRWIETVFVKELSFKFEENTCVVTETLISEDGKSNIVEFELG